MDDGVVEGRGQGGGVEGFRFFKVCNTLDVGLQDINSGSQQHGEIFMLWRGWSSCENCLRAFPTENF